MSYQQTGEAGIGGWLRVLILILCFATPLTGIVFLTNDLAAAEHVSPQIVNSPKWLDAKLLLWVSLALRSTGLFYAGWRLSVVHRWSSVRVALLLLWIAGPIAIAVTNLMVSGQLGQQELGSPTPLGWPIASAIVWSAYLLSSARVAVTYLPRAEEQQATDQVRMRSFPRLNLTLRKRQGFFAAGLWFLLVLVFGLFLDSRYEGFFRNGFTLDLGRLAAWAIVPPTFLCSAAWAYSKFVSAHD